MWLGSGLRAALVPDVLKPLPESLVKFFESLITTSGVLAIAATLLLTENVNRRRVGARTSVLPTSLTVASNRTQGEL